jgi:lambda repressor-like predicted transcriptional regulator
MISQTLAQDFAEAHPVIEKIITTALGNNVTHIKD